MRTFSISNGVENNAHVGWVDRPTEHIKIDAFNLSSNCKYFYSFFSSVFKRKWNEIWKRKLPIGKILQSVTMALVRINERLKASKLTSRYKRYHGMRHDFRCNLFNLSVYDSICKKNDHAVKYRFFFIPLTLCFICYILVEW